MAFESWKNIDINLKKEDVEVYKANHEAFKGRQSRQEVVQYYNQWGETGRYDQQMTAELYTGPEKVARYLSTYFNEDDKATARVLDVAAGTGKLGAELYSLGFRNIDALDPSEGMLKKAKDKGVYTNFIHDFIGLNNPVCVTDGAYDGLACSGGFGEGHIPPAALYEMIRIVQPGGVICIAVREEYFYHTEEYKEALMPLMNKLEKEGKWKLQAKDSITNYAFGLDGIMFQYEVL